MSTTALTKVTTSALSKLRPHVFRWFLKKYYPFDTKKLIIEFNEYPNISLNFTNHDHTMWFGFSLNNFTYYEVELLKFDCQIRTEGYDIARIKDAVPFTLKADGTFKFHTQHQLTPGEAAKVKRRIPADGPAFATFLFHFTVRTRFGIQEVWMPDKNFCVQVRRHE